MGLYEKKPNALIHETSPYLLQHAYNPVQWYPWGEEAFERARREDKPVFLSIGYSTCHWCHVMARESFEDTKTAELLNRHFIAVKVDREERPDIDSVYMEVLSAFTGGGWPASIFLTPDQKPFYAGTYFPVTSRRGMIGFRGLLQKIAGEWGGNRSRLLQSAEELLQHLREREESSEAWNTTLAEAAVKEFARIFDGEHGGFGGEPKFPMPHNLLFLLCFAQRRGNAQALHMAETTLIQMRKGGLFDQIGFGFSRYSTDRFFLVPHFEKMLYDNALLLYTYAAAYAVTKKPLYFDTAKKTAAYVLRELKSPSGAFYSAQDADSGGEEGKFYLFSYEELLAVLGKEEGQRLGRYYGMTRKGNFEGKNIPNRLHAQEAGDAFDAVLPKLRAYRKRRAALHLDDKILTSWNALMIAALAFFYRVSGEKHYLDTATRAEAVLTRELSDGVRLFVSWREGKRSGSGFLDDYAFFCAALLSLYDATLDKTYLQRAEALCHEAIRQFADVENGGFFFTGRENERLILTPKETYDGAIPSGNAMMACCLVRLSQITGKPIWEAAAKQQLDYLLGVCGVSPAGHSLALTALLLWEGPPPYVTVALGREEQASHVRKQLPLYADVTFLPSPTKEYPLLNGRTTYYVCRGNTCLAPTNTLADVLDGASSGLTQTDP